MRFAEVFLRLGCALVAWMVPVPHVLLEVGDRFVDAGLGPLLASWSGGTLDVGMVEVALVLAESKLRLEALDAGIVLAVGFAGIGWFQAVVTGGDTRKALAFGVLGASIGLVVAAPVLVLGDLNIAPLPHDVWDVEAMQGVPSYHPKEHEAWVELLQFGLEDVVLPHITPGAFSFWDYRGAAFRFNKGMRIDHVLATPSAAERVTGAGIQRPWRKKKKDLKAALDEKKKEVAEGRSQAKKAEAAIETAAELIEELADKLEKAQDAKVAADEKAAKELQIAEEKEAAAEAAVALVARFEEEDRVKDEEAKAKQKAIEEADAAAMALPG